MDIISLLQKLFKRKKTSKENIREKNKNPLKIFGVFMLIIIIVGLLGSYFVPKLILSSLKYESQSQSQNTSFTVDQNGVVTTENQELETVLKEELEYSLEDKEGLISMLIDAGYSEKEINETLEKLDVNWEEREDEIKKIEEEAAKDTTEANKEAELNTIKAIQKVLLDNTGLSENSAYCIATTIKYANINSIATAKTTGGNKIEITNNNTYELLLKNGSVQKITNKSNNKIEFDAIKQIEIAAKEEYSEEMLRILKNQTQTLLIENLPFNFKQAKAMTKTLSANNINSVLNAEIIDRDILKILTNTQITYIIKLELMKIQTITRVPDSKEIYNIKTDSNKDSELPPLSFK